jgi:PIN domain nuclease of toxin-antitoxin system
LIVLDTHTWIWYASEDPQLSKRALLRINRARALGVHPISCWEVAMLFNSGRLKLNLDIAPWIEHALARPKIELLPFTPAAAVRAAGLAGSFPMDPADRFIVAAAGLGSG